MMLLRKAILVQFFLYEREVIFFDLISAVFGGNGGGKTTLIDAIQLGIMGAARQKVSLNALATDKRSKRSIRSYCLGQYGEHAHQIARDSALTYITLIWEDEDSKEVVSSGVCISADVDHPGHKVMGQYILRGAELQLSDHVIHGDGSNSKDNVVSWDVFQHRLKERGKLVGAATVFADDPKRYTTDLLLALRGKEQAPHLASFSRAFRFATRMRIDESVDAVVRHDVLDENPTGVESFRAIATTWIRISDQLLQLERKLEDGQKVLDIYNKAVRDRRLARTNEFLGLRASVLSAESSLNRAVADLEVAKTSVVTGQERLLQLQNELSEARKRRDLCREAREAHASHKDYGTLHEDIRRLSEGINQAAANLGRELAFLRLTVSRLADAPYINMKSRARLSSSAEDIEALVREIDTVEEATFNARVKSAVGLVKAVSNEVFQERANLTNRMEKLSIRKGELGNNLARLKKGEAALDPHVDALMTMLSDRGLSPVPVCDLVKIADSEWQSAIEGYLKMNAQALLIESEEESLAFKVARTSSRGHYGVKMAQESKQQIGKSYPEGSVANLIVVNPDGKGNKDAAVAYLRRILGDLQCADSDAEALSGRRTLTKDGMLVTDGGFERLKPVEIADFRIGGSRNNHAQIAMLTNQLSECEREIRELGASKLAVEEISGNMSTCANSNTEPHFASSIAVLRTQGTQVVHLKGQLGQADNQEYVSLGEKEREWEAIVTRLDGDAAKLGNEIAVFEERVAQARNRVTVLTADYDNAQTVVLAATSDELIDHIEGEKMWASRLAETESDGERMAGIFAEAAKRAINRMEGAANQATELFTDFRRNHQETGVDASDWLSARTWLAELLEHLASTQLVQYRTEVEKAFDTARESFKHDVALTLSARFLEMGAVLDQLNRVLRECPLFTNGERYQFVRSVRPAMQPLYNFISNVDKYGIEGDLFGGPGQVPTEFQEVMENLKDGVPSVLEDYREFFDFDIGIERADPESGKFRQEGRLSSRVGTASGGEHKSPMYVIAGAALMSAYHLNRNGNTGIRLMLIDEAFMQMDFNNTITTMRYLEELGLQVFVASPGEKRGELTAFLHSYYNIEKDPDARCVLLSREVVSQRARELCRGDLLEYNPELLEGALHEIRMGSPKPEMAV